MRRYLTLLSLLVTLSLAGCGGPGTYDSPWRTPSGARIDQNVPDFGPGAAGTQTPLATAGQGANAVTPYYNQQATEDLPPVKVALLVPMSGPQGNLGQAMLNAAQMALFDTKANNVTIVPRDTATGAAKAAHEALAEGAQIILGPLFAQDVKAVAPIARSRAVPVIAFSTDWSVADDNTYVMGFLPFGQVGRVVEYAAKHGSHKFAALIPQSPYGMAVSGTLKRELSRQNLDSPQIVAFNDRQLAQAVQALADATRNGQDSVLLPVGGAQLRQIAVQLRQNDIDMQHVHFVGTGLWDDSAEARSVMQGGWYAAPDPKLRAAFVRQYTDTYGAAPPRLTSLAYDATALASALAVKGLREKKTPAFDRTSLTNPNGFAGIDGVFRFRTDSLAERGLAVLELQPGGAVVIDPAPTRF